MEECLIDDSELRFARNDWRFGKSDRRRIRWAFDKQLFVLLKYEHMRLEGWLSFSRRLTIYEWMRLASREHVSIAFTKFCVFL